MSDLLRIFCIAALMYLSFRLGEEHAGRKAYQALMQGIQEAVKEIDNFVKTKKNAPNPNEMLHTNPEDSQL